MYYMIIYIELIIKNGLVSDFKNNIIGWAGTAVTMKNIVCSPYQPILGKMREVEMKTADP